MRIISDNLYLHAGLSFLVENSLPEAKTKRLVFIDTTYLAELTAADFDGFVIYITPKRFNTGWETMFYTEVKKGETIDMTMPVTDIREKIERFVFFDDVPLGSIQPQFRLTQKEASTIKSIACGMTPDNCSKLTGISIKTISSHKRSAMEKLGLKTQQELFCTLRLLMKYTKAMHVN
ncbi:MAG TPA: helix-turn-helix transcriptional regulator [Buttiauxella sp.]